MRWLWWLALFYWGSERHGDLSKEAELEVRLLTPCPVFLYHVVYFSLKSLQVPEGKLGKHVISAGNGGLPPQLAPGPFPPRQNGNRGTGATSWPSAAGRKWWLWKEISREWPSCHLSQRPELKKLCPSNSRVLFICCMNLPDSIPRCPWPCCFLQWV